LFSEPSLYRFLVTALEIFFFKYIFCGNKKNLFKKSTTFKEEFLLKKFYIYTVVARNFF